LDNVFLKDIFARLGIVKNPVLFSSSTFSMALMFFSKDFVLAERLIANLTGACMFLMAVLIFLVALGFYIYAYLNLPSSTQELIFLQEAKKAVDRHHQGGRKTRLRQRADDE
jgi:hypothetical protein